MKKVLSKFKKYSFWVAFTGVIVIFIKNLASLIGFDVDTGVLENVIMSLCGVFVVLGLVTKDNTSAQSSEQESSTSIVENTGKTTNEPVSNIDNNDSDVDK